MGGSLHGGNSCHAVLRLHHHMCRCSAVDRGVDSGVDEVNEDRLDQCNVRLLRTEIDVIAAWHRHQENECARSSEYRQAEVHKNRADQLLKIADWLIRRSAQAAE
jgi:hypothetical protein